MPEVVEQQETGQAGATGAGAGSTTDASKPGTGQGTQGAASGTGQGTTGTPQKFEYTEDRSKWIPPHRLTEESTKRTRLEQEHAAATARLAERERQIAALTGARTPAPEEQQVGQIREALEKVYPWLKKFGELTEEQADRLLGTPEFVARQEQQEQAHWSNFADRTKDSVSELIAEGLGVEKLSEDQQDDMFEAFRNWTLKRYQSEMETNGQSQTQTRYERSDPTLLKEFSDRYLKNWAEPMRRKVTAQETARTRRVPQSTQRTTVSQVQRPQKFKSLDERIDFAAKQAKERGLIRDGD